MLLTHIPCLRNNGGKGPDKDTYTLRGDARRYEFWESNISVRYYYYSSVITLCLPTTKLESLGLFI